MIASLQLFEGLAERMNAEPSLYESLGDVDIDLGIEMTRSNDEPFRALLGFHGIRCDQVTETTADGLRTADCVVRGDAASWTAMFEDIAAHGHATGAWTINSLTLLGEHMTVSGDDPLGVDRFFRFNQTIQSFLDGYATQGVPA